MEKNLSYLDKYENFIKLTLSCSKHNYVKK